MPPPVSTAPTTTATPFSNGLSDGGYLVRPARPKPGERGHAGRNRRDCARAGSSAPSGSVCPSPWQRAQRSTSKEAAMRSNSAGRDIGAPGVLCMRLRRCAWDFPRRLHRDGRGPQPGGALWHSTHSSSFRIWRTCSGGVARATSRLCWPDPTAGLRGHDCCRSRHLGDEGDGQDEG